MSFSIKINETALDAAINDEPAVSGRIEIGAFHEDLVISLLLWSVDDYVRQWKEGLSRLSHTSSSCVITSMRDLSVSDFVNWWILYRFGEKVVFQNQIIMASDPMRTEFERSPYEAIPSRITHNEMGQEISEWEVPYRDIEAFLGTHDFRC